MSRAADMLAAVDAEVRRLYVGELRSLGEVSERLHMGLPSVRRSLVRLGVELRTDDRDVLPATRAQLRLWYVARGEGLEKIARRLQCGTARVKTMLATVGVGLRKSHQDRASPVAAPVVVVAPPLAPPPVEEDTAARCACGLRVDKDHGPQTCDMRGGVANYARRGFDYWQNF